MLKCAERKNSIVPLGAGGMGEVYGARDGLDFCATCSTITLMKKAGIREARQNLSALVEQVKKGREILITDRGRPVARLVPPVRPGAAPFPDLSRFRRTMPVLAPPLSGSIVEDRGDRF